MIELLRRAAASDPNRIAVVTGERSHTYRALVAVADRWAAGLEAASIDRFGVAIDDPATVVALLAAASAGGSEACQYPPSDDPAEVLALARRFDHGRIVSDRSSLVGVDGVLRVDDLEVAAAQHRRSDAVIDVRPLLLLTTGTTGEARGVRYDWSRLLRSVERIGPNADQRWLLAFGTHQFAGLQVMLHVLAAGATLVATGGMRPKAGLEAIRAHHVTHVSATPTWWRFLLVVLRSSGGPAPELEQVTLGGEAASGQLLEDLAWTFPGARVSQVYAASEIGSTGTVRDGRSGLDLSVLDRDDDADIALKIVDGELWVRSRIGMLGYYGEDPVDPEAWRPTGDLVEVVQDRIEFRGRTSDVINVGGVKVHPLPIEALVERVPGVRIARAHGRPSRLTGEIVAVDVVAEPGADEAALGAAVRTACAQLPAAARPRSIHFVEELVTRGGKRVRGERDR